MQQGRYGSILDAKKAQISLQVAALSEASFRFSLFLLNEATKAVQAGNTPESICEKVMRDCIQY